jgi:hypothetical protein
MGASFARGIPYSETLEGITTEPFIIDTYVAPYIILLAHLQILFFLHTSILPIRHHE